MLCLISASNQTTSKNLISSQIFVREDLSYNHISSTCMCAFLIFLNTGVSVELVPLPRNTSNKIGMQIYPQNYPNFILTEETEQR